MIKNKNNKFGIALENEGKHPLVNSFSSFNGKSTARAQIDFTFSVAQRLRVSPSQFSGEKGSTFTYLQSKIHFTPLFKSRPKELTVEARLTQQYAVLSILSNTTVSRADMICLQLRSNGLLPRRTLLMHKRLDRNSLLSQAILAEEVVQQLRTAAQGWMGFDFRLMQMFWG